MKEWRYSSTVIDFGTKWRRVISFMHLSFYLRQRAPVLSVQEPGCVPEPVWKLETPEKSLTSPRIEPGLTDNNLFIIQKKLSLMQNKN
jgi:hypothetical protein